MSLPFTKFRKHYRPLQLSELVIGLKYIHVLPYLTPSEKRSREFHIYTLEGKGRYRGETDKDYLEYKRLIKKWVVNGELYSIANPSSDRNDQSNPLDLFKKK